MIEIHFTYTNWDYEKLNIENFHFWNAMRVWLRTYSRTYVVLEIFLAALGR